MRLLSNITSSSKNPAAIVLICMSLLSCKLDPADPNARRLTLGDVRLALVSTLGSRTDIEFRGRVVGYDKIDSFYVAPGLGTYKHFIEVLDTISGDRVWMYYTLPVVPYLKVDTTLHVVLIYKKIAARSALLIKDKSDSLLCLFGTLLLPDLELIETKGGIQNIRVVPGSEPFTTRNTTCGREGDFNTVFADRSNATSVQPAKTSVLFSGEKSYFVANIGNSYLIKNTKGCTDSVAQFAYAVIRQ